MQSAEKFIREFLRAQAEMLKQQLKRFAPFRRKLYTDDCYRPRRHAEKLKELLNSTDRIIRVSSSETEG